MRKSLLAASLLLSSSVVMAASPSVMSNFSYDYFEARVGISPLTFGAGASKSIHPNAHAIMSLDSEFDSDYNLSAGLGFHAPINNWADLTGEALFRLVDDRVKYNNDAGMEVNLGLRQWIGPQFELGGKIGYYSINNKAETDDVYGTLYGRFHATELFSIGLEARINDFYGHQAMVTARFKY